MSTKIEILDVEKAVEIAEGMVAKKSPETKAREARRESIEECAKRLRSLGMDANTIHYTLMEMGVTIHEDFMGQLDYINFLDKG